MRMSCALRCCVQLRGSQRGGERGLTPGDLHTECHHIPPTLHPPLGVSPWDQVEGDVLLQGKPLLASVVTRAMPRAYLYGEHYWDHPAVGERVSIVLGISAQFHPQPGASWSARALIYTWRHGHRRAIRTTGTQQGGGGERVLPEHSASR